MCERGRVCYCEIVCVWLFLCRLVQMRGSREEVSSSPSDSTPFSLSIIWLSLNTNKVRRKCLTMTFLLIDSPQGGTRLCGGQKLFIEIVIGTEWHYGMLSSGNDWSSS